MRQPLRGNFCFSARGMSATITMGTSSLPEGQEVKTLASGGPDPTLDTAPLPGQPCARCTHALLCLSIGLLVKGLNHKYPSWVSQGLVESVQILPHPGEATGRGQATWLEARTSSPAGLERTHREMESIPVFNSCHLPSFKNSFMILKVIYAHYDILQLHTIT